MHIHRNRAALALGLLLMAAPLPAAASTAPIEAPAPPPRPTDIAERLARERALLAGFPLWVDQFKARARAEGIPGDIVEAAFRGVELNGRVLKLDRSQAEFSRAIWEYLDRAVSTSRVSTGRSMNARHDATLGRIEARYGVPRGVLLAIWGVETSFGANFGKISVIESLSTLAYDGRRREWAESELMAALRILADWHVTPRRMVGSWAGAMGHTQFLPSSVRALAVDFTGDGKQDLWDSDPADALASSANFLSSKGWERGGPIMQEVRLAPGFDLGLADEATWQQVGDWRALGVTAVSGALADGQRAQLLLPAGAKGPAFLVYPNFFVIKRYNPSTSYAMAVTLLSERVTGARPARPLAEASWPVGERQLSRTEKKELQARLTALGHDTGGVDGVAGRKTRAAVRSFQRARGMAVDGYVSGSLFEAVRSAAR